MQIPKTFHFFWTGLRSSKCRFCIYPWWVDVFSLWNFHDVLINGQHKPRWWYWKMAFIGGVLWAFGWVFGTQMWWRDEKIRRKRKFIWWDMFLLKGDCKASLWEEACETLIFLECWRVHPKKMKKIEGNRNAHLSEFNTFFLIRFNTTQNAIKLYYSRAYLGFARRETMKLEKLEKRMCSSRVECRGWIW